eukprot:224607-Pleurochrysis_carterae.AAC.1
MGLGCEAKPAVHGHGPSSTQRPSAGQRERKRVMFRHAQAAARAVVLSRVRTHGILQLQAYRQIIGVRGERARVDRLPRACARACVCVRVRVRACVRACVCACVRVR